MGDLLGAAQGEAADGGAGATGAAQDSDDLHLPFGIDIPMPKLPDISLTDILFPGIDLGNLPGVATSTDDPLGGDSPTPDSPTTDPLDTGSCAASATNISVGSATKTVHGKSLADIAPNFDGTEGGSVTRGSIGVDYCPDPKDAPPKSAVVNIPVTKTMPSWPEAGQTCKAVQDEWNRFYAAIDRHESRHVSIIQSVYSNVHQKLVGQKDPDAALDKVTAEEDKQQDAFHKEASAYSGMKLDAGISC